MKPHTFIKSASKWMALAAVFCLGLVRPAFAWPGCNLTFTPYPAPLSADVTAYPGYNPNLGPQQQLSSLLLVDVTTPVNGTNYPNPPIPYGQYPTWCIDQTTPISAAFTIPGTFYTGELYSTCDPNLNSELPPGHANTLVSPATWQMVNYILNFHTINGTNAFYWDTQAAIATLVGSVAGTPNPCGGTYTTPVPDGGCQGYPVFDPAVVSALLTAASNNAPSWIPQCGDVLGAIFVTADTNQFIMLEIPVPCTPCVNVTKTVACLGPTNSCGSFSKMAEGFAGVGCNGVSEPAFCYQITITNCGTVPLTNVVVSDNLLGNLTANFFTNGSQVFQPGATLTSMFTMPFAASATNTVTVTGDASLSQSVTNGNVVLTNGTTVSASDSAVALIDTAAVSCNLSLFSPNDLDGVPNDNNVTLPAATFNSSNNVVTLSIQVCNTGKSDLTGVTINMPGLSAFNCSAPGPFNLAAGQCQTFQLCLGVVTCPAQMNFAVNVTGDVAPDATHCGVYDMTSTNLVSVCSSCSGSISCSNTCLAGASGIVALDCSPTSSSIAGDSGLAGVTVTLLDSANNVLTNTTTDAGGNYSFTNMAPGTYYIMVTPPAGYVETYPPGNTTGEVPIQVSLCLDTVANFGYANTAPPIITVPPGGPLGCNPATLPTDMSVASNVTVVVSCGSATTNVSYVDSTNGCVLMRTFTIVVTDTYGNSGTNSTLVYTWTADTAAPVLSGVPVGTNYGCNPATVATTNSILVGVTASDTCSPATVSATVATNGSGCIVTQIFTILATNACGNMATAYVTNIWTVDTTPPTLMGVPAGTNYGCNPASVASLSAILSGVTASDTCSQPTISGSTNITTSGCLTTEIFTITASDSCGNMATAYVTNTWTTDTAAPVLMGVPAGTNYGCNPASVATLSAILSGVTASDTCSLATVFGSAAVSSNGCLVSEIFTITATNACRNMATAYVTNTWTADTAAPVLMGVPAGTNYGCNPKSVATLSAILSGVSASDTCSPATVSGSSSISSNGCAVTQIFTILATNACGNMATAYVTNTWTTDTAAPMLSGVPAGTNYGCNPKSVATPASIQAQVSASDTCSAATVKVTSMTTSNGCVMTQIFTITATNSCGNLATAYVTNTWTADTTPPMLTGVPPGKNLGCNPTTLPTVASIQGAVTASDTCSPATVHVTGMTSTNGCQVTEIFTIIATNACGNMATACVTNTWTDLPPTLVTNFTYITNISYLTNFTFVTNVSVITNVTYVTNTTITTNCCTNSVCGNFNSQNPSTNCWLWLNAHGSCNPGVNCNVTCQNASVTLACNDGKSYTFPIPNGQINFSSTCTTATNWFDGTSWHTTLPCAGDSQIFLQGCGIPWQSDFANCQSVCWTATFCSATPGLTCNWQWGAACYNDSLPTCGSVCPKACLQTACPSGKYYSSGDQAGCPENHKPYCVAGGTGGGGANCTGSWSGTCTTCAFGTKTNITVMPVITYSTNTTVKTNTTVTTITTVTTNTTVTTMMAGPVLSGVPTGVNLGCNPTSIPTLAGVEAAVSASETCSTASITVTEADSTNACMVTQIFTITAGNVCGGATTVDVTNTWTVDKVPPVITGVPASAYLGCSATNLPGDANVLAEVKATDQCSTPSVTVTHVDSTNSCLASRTFTITAVDGCGNISATNLIYTWTVRTPDYCTNVICSTFNSQNPGGGWLWLNAHCSGNPGQKCTLYCQNATVTLNCRNGQKYTYSIPNGQINFSPSCTVATNWFDGAQWNTTLPCAGDDEIFLQGCAIPWNSAFAGCQSVCWTGVFSCDTPGQAFNWQFGAACYADQLPAYSNICPKACHLTSCQNGQYYNSSDHAGCPENHKPSCVGGGTGGGGANCTGSWSGTDTTCTFAPGTTLPPVLNGVPPSENLGLNPTNIPTTTSILSGVTVSDTCSPATISATMIDTTNSCMVTQIFTITAINGCGNSAMAYVTNTWTTMSVTNSCTNTVCCSFNSQNPNGGWLWCNAHISGMPGQKPVTVYCQNATITLNCKSGKTYTYPVPNGQINFSPSCTGATNWFDGTQWNTTVPCSGDDQIFLQGCGIPWNSDFANCQSVCWTGRFTCNVPGFNCNWQFGCACYNDTQPTCANICPKACHQTPCQNGYYYNQNDQAGCPENHSPYCVSGGSGNGGGNCTGSWSNTGTCSF